LDLYVALDDFGYYLSGWVMGLWFLPLVGLSINLPGWSLGLPPSHPSPHGDTLRGQYDRDYLTYLRALLQGMTEAGLVGYVVSLGVLGFFLFLCGGLGVNGG
jgi:hypothetical protein